MASFSFSRYDNDGVSNFLYEVLNDLPEKLIPLMNSLHETILLAQKSYVDWHCFVEGEEEDFEDIPKVLEVLGMTVDTYSGTNYCSCCGVDRNNHTRLIYGQHELTLYEAA